MATNVTPDNNAPAQNNVQNNIPQNTHLQNLTAAAAQGAVAGLVTGITSADGTLYTCTTVQNTNANTVTTTETFSANGICKLALSAALVYGTVRLVGYFVTQK